MVVLEAVVAVGGAVIADDVDVIVVEVVVSMVLSGSLPLSSPMLHPIRR